MEVSMLRSYHRVQEYSYHGTLSEFPNGESASLCGGKGSSLFVPLLLVGLLAAVIAGGAAYLQGGAEEVVYRRAAEVRAGV